MTRWYVAVGWCVTGMLVGAVLLSLLLRWGGFTIDTKLPIVELAQLAAIVFLALYIPFAIESYIDRARSVRGLLVDDVRAFMSIVQGVNAVLTACTNAGVTTAQDLMRIRTGFLSGNVKLGRLEKRLFDTCGERCRPSFFPFKEAYIRYWHTVTGGSLYGGGRVDWDLWRRQEFAFTSLEHEAAALVRYLTTS